MEADSNPSPVNSVLAIEENHDSPRLPAEDSDRNSSNPTEIVIQKPSSSKSVRWSTPLTEVKIYHPEPGLYSKRYINANIRKGISMLVHQRRRETCYRFPEDGSQIHILNIKTFFNRFLNFVQSSLYKHYPVINSRIIFGLIVSAAVLCFCYLLWSTSGSHTHIGF